MNQSGDEERLVFLDNLRAVVIVFIIVLHGSMTYMTYAPEWWYVVDPETSGFFTILALLIDVPVMFILLFIAGYFVYPSVVKRRGGEFMRNKFKRIGIPWLIGVFFLAPPIAYLIVLSRNLPIPYALFLEEHFWTEYFQQSVYWFLGVLFLLFGTVRLLYSASVSFRSLRLSYIEPTWTKIAIFLGVMSTGFFIINMSVPVDTWRHYGYLIMVQPVRIPLYIGYFYLGVYAFKNGWFRDSGFLPDVKLWFPLTAFSAAAYVTAHFALDYELGPFISISAVIAITFNMFCYSSIMSLVALFRKYMNGHNMFWKSQARNTYGMYYLHPLILFPLALYMVQVEISIFIKAPVIIIVTWFVSWLISTAVLTRSPILRDIF